MKLTLHPEDTGKRNWESTRDCPIACSLKRAGFNNILVASSSWAAQKNGTQFYGSIDRNLNNYAKQWANNKIKKPIEFTINDSF